MIKDWEKEVKLMQMETTLANEKEYHKWQKEIPSINFPSDWKIRMIPPFGGAIVRFIVIKGDKEVSVYLDCYDRLGYFGKPYWEIYPTLNDDIDRFAMDDIDGLLKGVEESLGGKSLKPPIIESIDYTVQKGDTLWGIAKKYLGDGYMWRVIYLENKKIIGDNPDLIIPGMTLTLRFWRNE